MKKILAFVLVLGALVFGLTGCSGLESAASWAYDIHEDLDGDGDSGDRSGEYNPSFKGGAEYGRCNSGCGCQVYVPVGGGDSRCANCMARGCSTNKFGHKH